MMNDETKKMAAVKKGAKSEPSSFNIHHSTFSYPELLGEIKARVRAGQQRAALAAHAEMLMMYWDIGRMIAVRQEQEGWGAGVIPRLATDLRNELPEEKGFSKRNLTRMLRFFREYSAKVPPVVAQLKATVARWKATGVTHATDRIVGWPSELAGRRHE